MLGAMRAMVLERQGRPLAMRELDRPQTEPGELAIAIGAPRRWC
jgi:D-arabinose 1-dehydrogenase-like Zn-dependent alcohol dehydrogenase